MGKARIVSGGAGGSYTIEVKYDTTRIDARLADIEATLPIIQAELDALDTQLTTSRTELTAAVAAMNDQINLINANKPFDGAYIDGLIGDMQAATSDIENKNIQIDDAYQTLTGYEAAIDAATQDETAKRAAYQQAQATLSAYVAETGDTSSGYYLSQVADVENKLAAYQTAQQITVDTKSVFEPQIATQKAEIAQLKNELKILQDQYKSVNAEFVAVTQAMEAWSKQDQGTIDAAGKVAIQANAKYVLTKFKRDEKKREVVELTQEQKWLNKAKTQSSETRQAWCADLTTNLGANTEVGTIEIAQEWQGVPPMIIRPGYSGGASYIDARDGALHKLPNMSAHSAWFNMCLYPAMAKWKPQYRRGTLTAKSGNSGTVALDDTFSSATQVVGGVNKISINQSPVILTNVPIEYMTCNGNAFKVNDRVVVEFQNRDWSQPKIIGFVENPRSCTMGRLNINNAGRLAWNDGEWVYTAGTQGAGSMNWVSESGHVLSWVCQSSVQASRYDQYPFSASTPYPLKQYFYYNGVYYNSPAAGENIEGGAIYIENNVQYVVLVCCSGVSIQQIGQKFYYTAFTEKVWITTLSSLIAGTPSWSTIGNWTDTQTGVRRSQAPWLFNASGNRAIAHRCKNGLEDYEDNQIISGYTNFLVFDEITITATIATRSKTEIPQSGSLIVAAEWFGDDLEYVNADYNCSGTWSVIILDEWGNTGFNAAYSCTVTIDYCGKALGTFTRSDSGAKTSINSSYYTMSSHIELPMILDLRDVDSAVWYKEDTTKSRTDSDGSTGTGRTIDGLISASIKIGGTYIKTENMNVSFHDLNAYVGYFVNEQPGETWTLNETTGKPIAQYMSRGSMIGTRDAKAPGFHTIMSSGLGGASCIPDNLNMTVRNSALYYFSQVAPDHYNVPGVMGSVAVLAWPTNPTKTINYLPVATAQAEAVSGRQSFYPMSAY